MTGPISITPIPIPGAITLLPVFGLPRVLPLPPRPGAFAGSGSAG